VIGVPGNILSIPIPSLCGEYIKSYQCLLFTKIKLVISRKLLKNFVRGYSALEFFFKIDMRYINARFTYLLTYLAVIHYVSQPEVLYMQCCSIQHT